MRTSLWIATAGLAVAACAAVAGGVALATPGHDTTTHAAGSGITVQDAGPQIARRSATPEHPVRPSTATVTLLTGAKVTLATQADGAQKIGLVPGPDGAEPAVTTFTYGGDTYAVPAAAIPYYGTVIDPRLFDVSYLVRAKLDDAHSSTLPVRVLGRAGRALSLPGLVRPSVAAGAAGSLAKASAARFGDALVARWRALRAGSHAPAVLSDLTRLSLAAPASTPAPTALPTRAAAQSGVPFYTVRVKFVDRDGKPGAAVGWLQNVDDANLDVSGFSAGLPNPARRGPYETSVPAGNYAAMFAIPTPRPSGDGLDVSLVVDAEFAVHRDTTIVLDARTAKPYSARIDTSRPATLETDLVNVTRISAANGGLSSTDSGFGLVMGLASISHLPPDSGLSNFPIPTEQLFVSPTASPPTGFLGYEAYTMLWTTPYHLGVPASGPIYYLSFPAADRIPAQQAHVVSRASLTTVHSTQYEPAATSADCTDTYVEPRPTPVEPWGDTFVLNGIGAPVLSDYGRRTDYWYSDSPDTELWGFQNYSSCRDEDSELYRPTPGGTLNFVWGRSPLTPAPTAQLFTGFDDFGTLLADGGARGEQIWQTRICTACRQGNIADLSLSTHDDTDQMTYGVFDSDTTAFRFVRNGVVAVDSPDLVPSPVGSLPMLPEEADYQLTWTTTTPYLDQQSTTVWTFRSGPRDGVATLPSDVLCTPVPSRPCSQLPLLFVSMSTRSNYLSQVEGGHRVPFTIGVSAQNFAPAPVGVTATVAFSYDNGITWSAAQRAVRLSNGSFSATADVPAGGRTSGYVATRVTAVDRSGNSVQQTNLRAYGIVG